MVPLPNASPQSGQQLASPIILYREIISLVIDALYDACKYLFYCFLSSTKMGSTITPNRFH